MNLPNFGDSLLYRLRFKIGYLLLLVGGSLAISFNLNGLLPTITTGAAEAVGKSLDLEQIYREPMFAPFHLVQWLSLKYINTSRLLSDYLACFSEY